MIRIIHSNGRVEEISGTIKASEIMKAYPKHVLKQPTSPSSDDGVVPKIVVVPPAAELQRGKIYFLIPVPAATADQKSTRSRSSSTKKKKNKRERSSQSNTNNNLKNVNGISMSTNILVSDRYLSEILSEKLLTQRERRRGRVGVWRPHLETICESPSDVD